jgi:hypothetical protein
MYIRCAGCFSKEDVLHPAILSRGCAVTYFSGFQGLSPLQNIKAPATSQILLGVPSPLLTALVQLEMFFPLAFILTALPFFSAAIPLANSFASPGIAVPIAKRDGLRRGVVDALKLQSSLSRSVAYATPGFSVVLVIHHLSYYSQED